MASDGGGCLGLLIGKLASTNAQRYIAKQQGELVEGETSNKGVPNLEHKQEEHNNKKKREETLALAKEVATLLQHELDSNYTATSQASALVLLQVNLTSISQGSKWNRFLKNEYGFVKLGLSFSLQDAKDKKILKHGRMGYTDNLKDASIKERCGSGKEVLKEKLVPWLPSSL